MTEWNDFFVAMAGSSAALTGLIFVGLSISVSKMNSELPTARIFQSIINLLCVLIVSTLCLVPQQSTYFIGIALLTIGALYSVISLVLHLRKSDNESSTKKKPSVKNILFSQVMVLPYVISGVVTIAKGLIGLNWLVAAIIIAFIQAIMDAWMLHVAASVSGVFK